jgi:RES domain-containing protein
VPRPKRPPPQATPRSHPGILELDRFSGADLKRWEALSADLDELSRELFFALRPAQVRLRPQLIEALQGSPRRTSLAVEHWTRIVPHEFSLAPLSAAGSLRLFGGRFNAGVDLDEGTLLPWPALYLAEDYETAYREKFSAPSADLSNGLTPAELALAGTESFAVVRISGKIDNVLDLRQPAALDAVAKLYGHIEMPGRAKALRRKLGLATRKLHMIRTAQQLYIGVFEPNWRSRPAQFGLPANGQILAEIIRASGYEGILYKSTKANGNCLAVFPDKLTTGSFLELSDPAPKETSYTRLDIESADELCGFDTLPRRIAGSL